jgi:hypothetical protein
MRFMSKKSKRATVYFTPAVHRALRLKAVETEQSVSDLVNQAVLGVLAEDSEDLEAFEERAAESSLFFADVLKEMRQSGEL